MATILACIRASPLAFRTLRPLAGSRFYCDRNDGDAGDVPPEKKKLTLEELLQKTKILKPVAPVKLKSVKPPRAALPEVPDIDTKTVHVAREAAATLPGDVKKNLDDLLSQLKDVSHESRETLENIVVGMKIDSSTDRERRRETLADSDAAREALRYASEGIRENSRKSRDRRRDPDKLFRKFNLFGGPRLNVFSFEEHPPGSEVGCSLPVWDQLEERELKLMLAKSPRDGFDEMIQWTEQGKLWPFPIDNEHGMIDEADVKFEDHVFLDHLIEDDNAFPNGPVKQFMELVCVGLSKNPYISVERKHNCIEWYREYFTAKRGLIEAAFEQ